MRVWQPVHAQALQSARQAAGMDPQVLAIQHSISLRQLTELEEGGSGAFYSAAIKHQTGMRLFRSLGRADPAPAPAHAPAVALPLSAGQGGDVSAAENLDLLRRIAWAVVLAGLVLLAVNLVNGLGLRPGSVALLFTGLGMLGAVRAQRPSWAVSIMCVGALLMNAASAWVIMGLFNLSWIALPLAIIVSGWLWSARSAWWMAGLSAASVLAFYALHRAGLAFVESVPLEITLAGLIVAMAVAALVGSATARVFQRQLARIQRAQSDLDAVFNSSLDLICSLDVPGLRLRAYNQVFVNTMAALYGVRAQQGLPLSELMAARPDHVEQLQGLLHEALAAGSLQRIQPLFQGDREFDLRLRRIDSPDGSVTLSVFATDVTARVHAQRRLEYLVYHDPVTGMPNRESANLALQTLMDAPRPRALSLVLVRLHELQTVNDLLGHDGGDEYLAACAQSLCQVIARQGQVYRMPGNEFLLLLPGLEGRPGLAKICERLLAGFATPRKIRDKSVPVTATLGVAFFRLQADDSLSADRMIASANLALAEARRLGPGSYAFYQDEMSNRLQRQLRTRADLANALFNNELLLYFEPILDLKTQRLWGAEAQLRWNHPRDGLLDPAAFLQVAEASGYIGQLGRWLLSSACAQAARWQRSQGQDMAVAVKLSALHLAQPGLLQDVQSALAQSGLPPSCLELEIPENTLLQGQDPVMSNLQALRQWGVRIVIDDFGIGNARLSQLGQLAIDKIKIDKLFVAPLDQAPGLAAIVKGLIDMAHGSRVQVLAAGVETAAAWQRLRDLGCDQVQGRHLADPMPVADWDVWRARH